MTKYFTIIICIPLVVFTKAYSQNFEEKFKADICNCLKAKKQGRNTVTNVYKECFNENLTTYAAQIDSNIEEENNHLKYQEALKSRLELNHKFQYELVYSCDYYYDRIEAEKERKYAADRSNTYHGDLDKINQQLAMHPHSQMYFHRAKLHFNLSMLEEAKEDVMHSIKIHPLAGEKNAHNTQENILLAMILEKQKHYSQAATLYKEIYTAVPIVEIAILHAIVHKKAGASASDLKSNQVLNNTSSSSSEIATPKNTTMRRRLGLDNTTPVQENDRTRGRNQAREQRKRQPTNPSRKTSAKKKEETVKKDTALKSLFNYRKN